MVPIFPPEVQILFSRVAGYVYKLVRVNTFAHAFGELRAELPEYYFPTYIGGFLVFNGHSFLENGWSFLSDFDASIWMGFLAPLVFQFLLLLGVSTQVSSFLLFFLYLIVAKAGPSLNRKLVDVKGRIAKSIRNFDRKMGWKK